MNSAHWMENLKLVWTMRYALDFSAHQFKKINRAFFRNQEARRISESLGVLD